MAGAADPSIATALEEQSKSLKAQAKSLDSTQKILQRICDRFEHDELLDVRIVVDRGGKLNRRR